MEFDFRDCTFGSADHRLSVTDTNFIISIPCYCRFPDDLAVHSRAAFVVQKSYLTLHAGAPTWEKRGLPAVWHPCAGCHGCQLSVMLLRAGLARR